MNNKITITASDNKVFTGTLDKINELKEKVNDYEEGLKRKSEKEEAEKQKEEQLLKNIEDKIKELNEITKEYKKVSSKSIHFYEVNGQLESHVCTYRTINTFIDYINRFYN